MLSLAEERQPHAPQETSALASRPTTATTPATCPATCPAMHPAKISATGPATILAARPLLSREGGRGLGITACLARVKNEKIRKFDEHITPNHSGNPFAARPLPSKGRGQGVRSATLPAIFRQRSGNIPATIPAKRRPSRKRGDWNPTQPKAASQGHSAHPATRSSLLSRQRRQRFRQTSGNIGKKSATFPATIPATTRYHFAARPLPSKGRDKGLGLQKPESYLAIDTCQSRLTVLSASSYNFKVDHLHE